MLTIADLEATKTSEEVAAFLDSLKAEGIELETEYKGRTFDDAGQERFAAQRDLKKAAEARKAEFDARRAWVAELAEEPKRRETVGLALRPNAGSRLPDNLFDLTEYRGRTSSEESMVALMRDGARKVAEQAIYPHDNATPDRTVAHIHKLLARIDGGNEEVRPGTLARHILATGAPAYARGFGKYIAGRQHQWTNEERAAIATVGTTTTGGYAVPFTLDPTIILTSDGATNPLRGIARIEQTVGNTWKGLASAGVTASYAAEANATTDGAPTFTQPEVTVRKAKALIEFSIEADQDWPRLQSEMARLLQDAKDTLEAEKFVNGTGSGQNEPEGVLAGIASTSNVGTTGDGLTLDDFGELTTRLPDRWEPRARWLAHRALYNEVGRLDRVNGNGSGMYQPMAEGRPATLLGYPAHNSSAMESDFATSTNRVAIFGDFNQFLIVDKLGLTVELIPHLVDGSGNPTGERGLFAYWRNSSVVLVDGAFRVLTIGVVTTGI